jgi:hypothetical protein
LKGNYDDQTGEFQVAVGKGAYVKHCFHIGMELSGCSVPVEDQRIEIAGSTRRAESRLKRTLGLNRLPNRRFREYRQLWKSIARVATGGSTQEHMNLSARRASGGARCTSR